MMALPDQVVNRLRDAGVVDLGVRSMPDRRRSARGSFIEVEIRDGDPIEVRDSVDDIGRFVGFSTTYDQPYDVYGGPDQGGFREIMAAGAWTRTIAERVDINLLENHEGRPYARVGNGTLALSEPGAGVWNDAALDLRRGDARDLYLTLERGDYCKMSCAFYVTRQKWSADYSERRILEVIGADSSVVTFPANPHTFAGVEPPEPPQRDASRLSELRGPSLDLVRAEWFGLRQSA
jgi:HK97 family phage prohead protease